MYGFGLLWLGYNAMFWRAADDWLAWWRERPTPVSTSTLRVK